jgi:tight adherence protein C
MNEQHLLFASTFGGVAMLTWWLSRLLVRNDDELLRRRLRNAGQEARSKTADHQGIGSLLQRLGQAAASPFMPKTREKQSALRRQLGYAGIYSAVAIRTVTGCKVILLGAGFVGGYLAGLAVNNPLLGLSVGGLAGYLLPSTWLKHQIKVNQKELVRGLPDALDLLVVCVEAGLTVDAAMQRVAQELVLAHPRLSREMGITHMETRVGLSRAEALRNLGTRTGCAPIQTLATMLIQAERFGTSMAQSLRIQAESMRAARQNAAEEMAAKASVKLTFPVVLFIFPAVLIVLGAPAAIGLLKSALFAE